MMPGLSGMKENNDVEILVGNCVRYVFVPASLGGILFIASCLHIIVQKEKERICGLLCSV